MGASARKICRGSIAPLSSMLKSTSGDARPSKGLKVGSKLRDTISEQRSRTSTYWASIKWKSSPLFYHLLEGLDPTYSRLSGDNNNNTL